MKNRELGNIEIKNKIVKEDVSNYMIAVKTGVSYYEDIELGIYYDKARNGFSRYGYLGLYKDKSIVAIGKILNIIEFNNITGVPYYNSVYSDFAITKEEKEKINMSVEKANKLRGWNLEQENHYYYIVDKFVKTDFRKESEGALWGRKKFNLRKELKLDDSEMLPDIEVIAKMLEDKKW